MSRRPTVTIDDPLALFLELGDLVVIVEERPEAVYVWGCGLKARDLTTDRTYQRRKLYQEMFADGLSRALAACREAP